MKHRAIVLWQHDFWYRLRCFLWHRYTTVKSRYLPHTFVDRCEVLPHTMFEILSNFIEKECSPDDWSDSNCVIEVDGENKNIRAEIQYLYDWWHKSYNHEYNEVTEMIMSKLSKYSPKVNFVEIPNTEFSELNEEFDNADSAEMYRVYSNALTKFQKTVDEKLEEMMIRLVKIHKYLWT